MILTKRSQRDYKLIITSDGQSLTITPPLKIVFSADKSVYGGLNKMDIEIYNLNESNRLKFVKEREQQKLIKIELFVGYNEEIERVFIGDVMVGSNERSGADMITSFECLAGGFDMKNSYTNKTITADASTFDEIIKDMANTVKGTIEKEGSNLRPKVLIGSSLEKINEYLGTDHTMYIDEDKINIVKKGNALTSSIPIVDASTGLLNTPARESQKITFETKMNTSIKIGDRVSLYSVTAPHLDGIYLADTINYSGDYDGDAWDMVVSGYLFGGSVAK